MVPVLMSTLALIMTTWRKLPCSLLVHMGNIWSLGWHGYNHCWFLWTFSLRNKRQICISLCINKLKPNDGHWMTAIDHFLSRNVRYRRTEKLLPEISIKWHCCQSNCVRKHLRDYSEYRCLAGDKGRMTTTQRPKANSGLY